MVKLKYPLILQTAEKYPDADMDSLSKLCDCSIQTVQRAMKRPEAQHLKKPLQETVDECENDVDLLLRQLRILCKRPNPDIRALNALAMVLDKTDKLNYQMEEEEDWHQQLQKLNPSQLASVATRKDTSPTKDASEDSLYR